VFVKKFLLYAKHESLDGAIRSSNLHKSKTARYTDETDNPGACHSLCDQTSRAAGVFLFCAQKASASLQCSVCINEFLAIQLIAKNGLIFKAVFVS
jgi:hypothetical protein